MKVVNYRIAKYLEHVSVSDFLSDYGVDSLFPASISAVYAPLQSALQGSTSDFPYTHLITQDQTSYTGNSTHIMSTTYAPSARQGSNTDRTTFRFIIQMAVVEPDNNFVVGFQQLVSGIGRHSFALHFKNGNVDLSYIETTVTNAAYIAYHPDSGVGDVTNHESITLSGIDITKMNVYELIITISKGTSERINAIVKVNEAYKGVLKNYKDTDFNFLNAGYPFIAAICANPDVLEVYVERIDVTSLG